VARAALDNGTGQISPFELYPRLQGRQALAVILTHRKPWPLSTRAQASGRASKAEARCIQTQVLGPEDPRLLTVVHLVDDLRYPTEAAAMVTSCAAGRARRITGIDTRRSRTPWSRAVLTLSDILDCAPPPPKKTTPQALMTALSELRFRLAAMSSSARPSIWFRSL